MVPGRLLAAFPARSLFLVVLSVLILFLGSGGLPKADPASAQSLAGPIPEVNIDVEDDATPANTATSVGTIENCRRIDNNDILDQHEDTADVIEVDVVADGGGIPAYNPGGYGGLFGFGMDFNFETPILQVNAVNQLMLSNAGPGSTLLITGSGGPFPNNTGVSSPSQIETGLPLSATAESGEGVLARFDVEGIAAGLGDLTLSNVGVLDVASATYTITSINSTPLSVTTYIAVDEPCSTPTSDVKLESQDVTFLGHGVVIQR